MIRDHDLKKAIDNIMEVMGADGFKFAKFCVFINAMDERAKKGDKAAQKVLDVVRQFHRLTNIATN